jgi:ankyrin repeat protein
MSYWSRFVNNFLEEAVAANNVDEVKRLIEKGDYIHANHWRNHSPLEFAVGNPVMMKILIDAGVDINEIHRTNTRLHANVHNIPIMQMLLDFGADVNARNGMDDTALHCAIALGHVDSVLFLIEKGADVNARDYYECTPLQTLTSFKGYDDATFIMLAKLLLSKGADRSLKNCNGDTFDDINERDVVVE